MSRQSSPSDSLGRLSGARTVGGEEHGGEGGGKDPTTPSASVPARTRSPTYDSELGDARLEEHARLGLARSQSSQSVASLESPSSSTTPYPGLQYAPRQRANHSHRASPASFQPPSSLWKQQQPSLSTSASVQSPSPSLLGPFPNAIGTASSPVLSTMSVEGMVPDSVEQQHTGNSNAEQVSAAERLAKQQLRADAEAMGLRVRSVGWAILERIQSAIEGEWRELGEMLSRGEATLLLPNTPMRSSEATLSHAYNHVIFSTSPFTPPILFASSTKGKERETASLVTFKGLRADLIDDLGQIEPRLEFKSFVPREDMKFVAQMRAATRRSELFSTLAPLPIANKHMGQLPSFRLLARNGSLLLPPSLSRREVTSSQRSRTRSGSAGPYLTPDQRQANRSSASFATLFGGRREKRTSMVVGENERESREMSETDDDAAAALGAMFQVAQPTRSIAVLVIDEEIHRSQVLADLTSSMKARVRNALSLDGRKRALPAEIIDVVCSFAAIFTPPTTLTAPRPSPGVESRSGSTDTDMNKSPSNAFVQAPFLYSPDYLADSFQDFFNSIRSQLEEAGEEFDGDQELERVESIVCGEVYDRIFCPYISLDAFHDEALARRIEALNGMGITLHHLGLVMPEGEEDKLGDDLVRVGLDDIVARCGAHLKLLGDRLCVSPSDKLGVLVAAHKLIVEGLGRLPKIELVDDVEASNRERGEATGDKDRLEKAGSSTSSADLILPILIFCIIKSSPPKLASNLLYIQRFRAEMLIRGEASYCLVNVQAAVAFLENVEPASLGLQGEKDMVTAKELEFQSRRRYSEGAGIGSEGNNTLSMPMRMRSRVAHDVGELAGMSNRVITGVLGSSLGAFGRMMGAGTNFAMGIDASAKTATEGSQTKKKSVEDIRGILTGGAASKLGSVLNKVVAMENEGKGLREGAAAAAAEPSRPRPVPRTSSAVSRAPTDYGAEEPVSSILSSSKPSIGHRLAALPLLSRSSTANFYSPPPSNPFQQNIHGEERGSLSPAQATKDLPVLPSASTQSGLPLNSQASMLEPAYRGDGLRSPISPSPNLDPTLLHSPAHSQSQVDFSDRSRLPPIPASLQSPHPPLSQPPSQERPLHVVLATTGSVASVKVPMLVDGLLQHDNVRVQVISTKTSARFYDRRALLPPSGKGGGYSVEGLARENGEAGRGGATDVERAAYPALHVWTDEDEWNEWSQVGDAILHIELRRWADVVLVAPCSANTLAKINSGLCDDLLTCFLRALSPSTPTYLFPAMNTLMYLHPLTVRHLTFAREALGYHIIGPIEKRLACGDLGQGAMQEWTDIVNLVVERYSLVKKVKME